MNAKETKHMAQLIAERAQFLARVEAIESGATNVLFTVNTAVEGALEEQVHGFVTGSSDAYATRRLQLARECNEALKQTYLEYCTTRIEFIDIELKVVFGYTPRTAVQDRETAQTGHKEQ